MTVFSTFKKRLMLITILVISLSLLASCAAEQSQSEIDKLNVVVTTGMISDAVRQVGSEHVSVKALMGPGIDPHTYKATQQDVKALMDADIVFYHGLNLEGKMIEAIEKMGSEKPVVAVTAGLDRSNLLKDPEAAEYYDPHVWFDVSLWSLVIDEIAVQLAAADENNRASYEENARIYKEELAKLDDQIKKSMAAIPKDQRVLITAHDAFAYFGRAYEVEVVALQGISTDAEYSVRDVQSLVELIDERNVSTIFTETSVSDRALKAVLEGAKKRGIDVRFGDPLYSDSLGAADSPAATYTGMLKSNVQAITDGLTRR